MVCFVVAPAHPALRGTFLVILFTAHAVNPTKKTGQDGERCLWAARSVPIGVGGARTEGLLGVHPQARQVVAEEGDLVFGAGCQGEVGAAGPRLQAHEAAGHKPAALLAGPRLDGERHGSLVAQVNHVGYIWKHTERTGVTNAPGATP